MGGFIASSLSVCYRSVVSKFGKHKQRVVVVGLDAVGKTTLLYQMKHGELTTVMPTIGFIVETAESQEFEFTSWELGRPGNIRALWKYYLRDTIAIIFVVDASDLDRIEETECQLHRFLEMQETHDKKFLVFANKQDLPNALSTEQVKLQLELFKILTNPTIVLPCTATTGDGLQDGLDWLAKAD